MVIKAGDGDRRGVILPGLIQRKVQDGEVWH